MNRRQHVGRLGERLAKRHLEANGFNIVEINYRASGGEIDLIAEKDEILVFVEVRTRTSPGFGSPEESVTLRKRAHLVAASEEYLQAANAEGREWRIDVVALVLGSNESLVSLDVIENAVEM